MYTTEIIYGRQYQSVILMCQLDEPSHNLFVVVVWYIPSIAVIIFSIVKIQGMITKLANNEVATLNTQEPKLRRKSARKAVK